MGGFFRVILTQDYFCLTMGALSSTAVALVLRSSLSSYAKLLSLHAPTHPHIHFPHALVLHSTISTFFITARGRNHSCTIASFQTHTHTIQSFHAHYAMNARSHSLNAPFLQAYIYNPPTTSIKKSQHLIELILEILHCIHLITKTYPPKRKTPQFARNTRPYRYFLPLQ